MIKTENLPVYTDEIERQMEQPHMVIKDGDKRVEVVIDRGVNLTCVFTRARIGNSDLLQRCGSSGINFEDALRGQPSPVSEVIRNEFNIRREKPDNEALRGLSSEACDILFMVQEGIIFNKNGSNGAIR